ncbi:MAG: bifunctional isocitrate dehydrogenase kinase/phosphatase [Pseudomonadales bacterium]|nr:bifunctional isocitrate dehydrogenase kinase/phosphatase [Pseudomonadales bacterium]
MAALILEGFEAFLHEFRDVSDGARDRFASGDWEAVQAAAERRIQVYVTNREQVCRFIQEAWQEADWRAARSEFKGLIASHDYAPQAATFYNGVYRAIHPGHSTAGAPMFYDVDPVTETEPDESLTLRQQDTHLARAVENLLLETELSEFLSSPADDAGLIAKRLESEIPLLRSHPISLLETLKPVFYRNKGAYLIGRLVVEGHIFPLAIAFVRCSDGSIRTHAVLWGENKLSIVFSFTRSYFMLRSGNPSRIVGYLQSLLPAKHRWELYTSIGFYKHGKTEFVRGYQAQLKCSDDSFHIAEGIKGQVMTVFTLDSYQTVFKVIKDRFPATKSVSRQDVLAAYRLVKSHDRVGRMADTQEFINFELPRDRFEPDLLEELQKVASGTVAVNGDMVHFAHLYTERLMVPLNIYVRQCSDFQLQQVLTDYGYAIKDLAAANIFPGDMLLKNFGVTRHGRVVFYDYDEICYLTEVNFRDIPKEESGSHAAEAWFDVGEYDVFPQEFATFLFPDDRLRGMFSQHHADLFTCEGWQRIQKMIEDQILSDVFPYSARDRLAEIL